MDTMKNRGRWKMFMCFRPVISDEGSVNLKRTVNSGDPFLKDTGVAGGGKESPVIPKISKSLSEGNKAVSDVDFAGSGRRRKEKSRRRFYSVLKDVLFDTSLTQKIRNRKSRQNSLRSNSTQSFKSEKIPTEKTTPFQEISDGDNSLTTNSSRVSSLFSSSRTASSFSSRASSISLNSRSLSDRKGSFGPNSMELKLDPKQNPTKKIARYYNSNIGLCFLLICLLVLIFWGKICAIFCTSAWLFVAPGWFNGVDSPGKFVDSPDMESEEYKKRVIMEGLLGRNRSRLQ